MNKNVIKHYRGLIRDVLKNLNCMTGTILFYDARTDEDEIKFNKNVLPYLKDRVLVRKNMFVIEKSDSFLNRFFLALGLSDRQALWEEWLLDLIINTKISSDYLIQILSSSLYYANSTYVYELMDIVSHKDDIIKMNEDEYLMWRMSI